VKNQVGHVSHDIIIIIWVLIDSTNNLSLNLLVMLHHGLADSLNLLLVLALFQDIKTSRLLNTCIISEEASLTS
jgi:hypothetical protein